MHRGGGLSGDGVGKCAALVGPIAIWTAGSPALAGPEPAIAATMAIIKCLMGNPWIHSNNQMVAESSGVSHRLRAACANPY